MKDHIARALLAFGALAIVFLALSAAQAHGRTEDRLRHRIEALERQVRQCNTRFQDACGCVPNWRD